MYYIRASVDLRNQRSTNMIRYATWQRLLWKDALTIKPLLMAVGGGIVLMPLMVAAVSGGNGETRDAVEALLAMWVLLPNLVAIGAPALLIGNEEESGTLAWLRTLPVRWQTIADSKLIIALASVAAAWVLTSAILVLHMLGWSSTLTTYGDSAVGATWALEVSQLLLFSFTLLMCGFITAYLFRSPVAGLVALVPLITIVTFASVGIGRWLLGVRYYGLTYTGGASLAEWTRLVCAAVVMLLALWLIQRSMARRRLSAPASTIVNQLIAEDPMDAFRPPASIGLERPSIIGALVWQQWRQVVLFGLSMCGLSMLFLVLHSVDLSNHPRHGLRTDAGPLALLVLSATYLWLGAISFYGDSLRRRCGFFADRGVSPSMIWLTRLIPTAGLALVMLVPAMIVENITNNTESSHRYDFVAFLLLLFAVGQLVSQWSLRPILSFFAAPVLASTTFFLLVYWFGIYASFRWTIGLMVPVLLFATWRLTPRWLLDGMNRQYHLRAAAFLGLAILVPYLCIFGGRWATTPPQMTQWRKQMLAIGTPNASLASDWDVDRLESESVSPDAWQNATAPARYDINDALRGDLSERLESELAATQAIGHFVSYNELFSILINVFGARAITVDAQESRKYSAAWAHQPIDAKSRKLGTQAIAVALDWSRRIRELVIEGKEPLITLISVAEPCELHAVRSMRRLQASHPNAPELSGLRNGVSRKDLRRRSRTIAVIEDWQRFQRDSWDSGKSFADTRLLRQNFRWVPIEKTRSERYLDLVTKQLLEQLKSEVFFESDQEYEQWLDDWFQAQYGPEPTGGFRNSVRGELVDWVNALRAEPELQ